MYRDIEIKMEDNAREDFWCRLKFHRMIYLQMLPFQSGWNGNNKKLTRVDLPVHKLL